MGSLTCLTPHLNLVWMLLWLGEWSSPDYDLAHAESRKWNRYGKFRPGLISDLVPLIFSIFGGLFEETIASLKSIGADSLMDQIHCILIRRGESISCLYQTLAKLRSAGI
ncbi:hypothetical protein GEMRC1_013180 [Eukaryota sp. GEM-RC1]